MFDVIGTIFFLLGMYLIYNEFLLYLIEKPTYSTHHQTDIQKSHVPIIRVCPEPGLDHKKVTSVGYESHYSYFAGFKQRKEDNSWDGKENQLATPSISWKI